MALPQRRLAASSQPHLPALDLAQASCLAAIPPPTPTHPLQVGSANYSGEVAPSADGRSAGDLSALADASADDAASEVELSKASASTTASSRHDSPRRREPPSRSATPVELGGGALRRALPCPAAPARLPMLGTASLPGHDAALAGARSPSGLRLAAQQPGLAS